MNSAQGAKPNRRLCRTRCRHRCRFPVSFLAGSSPRRQRVAPSARRVHRTRSTKAKPIRCIYFSQCPCAAFAIDGGPKSTPAKRWSRNATAPRRVAVAIFGRQALGPRCKTDRGWVGFAYPKPQVLQGAKGGREGGEGDVLQLPGATGFLPNCIAPGSYLVQSACRIQEHAQAGATSCRKLKNSVGPRPEAPI